jgi:hypothetical protein
MTKALNDYEDVPESVYLRTSYYKGKINTRSDRGRVNKLKGVACEKFLSPCFPKSSGQDISIKKSLEYLHQSNYNTNYFVIKKTFRFVDKPEDTAFLVKHDFFNLNDLSSELISIFVKKSYYYKLFSSDRKKRIKQFIKNVDYYFCPNCNTKILANKKFSDVCLKCKKDVCYDFKYIHIEDLAKSDEVLIAKGFKKDVLAWLNEYKFIELSYLNRRTDFLTYDYETKSFVVVDSKNKEKTGLNCNDIFSCIGYVLELRRLKDDLTGDYFKVDNLDIIFNGYYEEEDTDTYFLNYINFFKNKYEFKINLIPLKHFYEQKINEGLVEPISHIDVQSKDDKYSYFFKKSDFKPDFIVLNILEPIKTIGGNENVWRKSIECVDETRGISGKICES